MPQTVQWVHMSIEMIALIFLGVIVLGFLVVGAVFGLGLYLGWFNMGPGNTAGKEFTMEADRIQKDKRAVQPNSDTNPGV